MTAPVISAQKADKSAEDEWFVSFVMPAGSTVEHLPDPNDPRVVLRQLAAETCIAASFRGTANEDTHNRNYYYYNITITLGVLPMYYYYYYYY